MNRKNLHTVKSLGLNVEAAKAGKTWLLLPEGYRDDKSGKKYPLPTYFYEIELLSIIHIPRAKLDAGCLYLNRCRQEYRNRQKKRQSATLDIAKRRHTVKRETQKLQADTKKFQEKARQAVREVQKTAAEATASLNDLFEVARKGLEGQMRAHIDGKEWQGEAITAQAFRHSAHIVIQAVKGLGIPTEQAEKAREAIMEEVAEGLKQTQETLALQASEPNETEH